MSFLHTLAGYGQILKYKIVFGADNTVGIQVKPQVPYIPGPDYIRFWTCHQAKIIYDLGYPRSTSAMMALAFISKIVEHPITPTTDVFELADTADVMMFSKRLPSNPESTLTGEFYAKGSLDRIVRTSLNTCTSEQRAVYSSLAILQYAININAEDKETLDIFTKTARNFVSLYESGMGTDMKSVIQIPQIAYMEAIKPIKIESAESNFSLTPKKSKIFYENSTADDSFTIKKTVSKISVWLLIFKYIRELFIAVCAIVIGGILLSLLGIS